MRSTIARCSAPEGGGKNPLIVFPDVDIEFATDIALRGMNFKHQSQSCASTSRILVHESICEQFTAQLVNKVGALKAGLPSQPGSDLGAITHKAQYEKVLSYIEKGRADGARLLVGGGALFGLGALALARAVHLFAPASTHRRGTTPRE